jgi:hypothetical protein
MARGRQKEDLIAFFCGFLLDGGDGVSKPLPGWSLPSPLLCLWRRAFLSPPKNCGEHQEVFVFTRSALLSAAAAATGGGSEDNYNDEGEINSLSTLLAPADPPAGSLIIVIAPSPPRPPPLPAGADGGDGGDGGGCGGGRRGIRHTHMGRWLVRSPGRRSGRRRRSRTGQRDFWTVRKKLTARRRLRALFTVRRLLN